MRFPRNPVPIALAFLIAFWLGRNHAAPYIHLLLTKLGSLLAHL
jgi:hypothetical protein